MIIKRRRQHWHILIICLSILLLIFVFEEYPHYGGVYTITRLNQLPWSNYDNYSILIVLSLVLFVAFIAYKTPENWLELTGDYLIYRPGIFKTHKINISEIDYFYASEHPWDSNYIMLKSKMKIKMPEELTEKREFVKILNQINISSR